MLLLLVITFLVMTIIQTKTYTSTAEQVSMLNNQVQEYTSWQIYKIMPGKCEHLAFEGGPGVSLEITNQISCVLSRFPKICLQK